MGTRAELLLGNIGKAIEFEICGGVFHEAKCPAEGRYKELEASMTMPGGGDLPIIRELAVKGYMKCLDCGARGFPSFRTIVESGKRKRVERIFKK